MNNLELDTLRSQIDKIDSELCELIKERQSLASKIMNAKKGVFPFDPKREEELIKQLVKMIVAKEKHRLLSESPARHRKEIHQMIDIFLEELKDEN